MRRTVLKWGDNFMNVRAMAEIDHNIDALNSYIQHLEYNNFELVAKNRDGIIVREKSIPDIPLKEDKPTEVTGEFFLFYDHLPEHIKKEIKIYINKTEK